MKSISLIVSLFAIFLTGCNSYYQIATLASQNVQLKESGDFTYSKDGICVEYDFWSEKGKVYFVVRNNSDRDIYLDKSRSYFINNGTASDYFQQRMYSSYESTTSQKNPDIKSIMQVNHIEYAEKKIEGIPARSSKEFVEFQLTDKPYRVCGLARNPKAKEDMKLTFDDSNSPLVYENRLMFVVDGKDISVVNTFYVSEIRNVQGGEVNETLKIEQCDGSTRETTVNRYQANNRYYHVYVYDSSHLMADTDRAE